MLGWLGGVFGGLEVTRYPSASIWRASRRAWASGRRREPVGPEVVVGDAPVEDVERGDQDRVGDGLARLGMAEAAPEAAELGAQVGALRASRGLGRLGEGGAQPLGALAGPARAALAGGLVEARAAGPPRRQPGRAAEARHVHADLGDEAMAVRRSTPGIVSRSASSGSKGAITRSTSVLSRLDRLVEVVELGQDLAHQQRVVAREATPERLPQEGQLRPQPAPGKLGEDLGSRVPATSAVSMSRPDRPRMSVATEDSLMPASWSTLSSRWASRPRSSICALR